MENIFQMFTNECSILLYYLRLPYLTNRCNVHFKILNRTFFSIVVYFAYSFIFRECTEHNDKLNSILVNRYIFIFRIFKRIVHSLFPNYYERAVVPSIKFWCIFIVDLN